MLIRCFPGATRDSYAADLGDAPPLALHAVFEPPITALEKLSLRARSLRGLEHNSEYRYPALQQHLAELSYQSEPAQVS
jgi:hypothetical protein